MKVRTSTFSNRWGNLSPVASGPSCASSMALRMLARGISTSAPVLSVHSTARRGAFATGPTRCKSRQHNRKRGELCIRLTPLAAAADAAETDADADFDAAFAAFSALALALASFAAAFAAAFSSGVAAAAAAFASSAFFFAAAILAAFAAFAAPGVPGRGVTATAPSDEAPAAVSSVVAAPPPAAEPPAAVGELGAEGVVGASPLHSASGSERARTPMYSRKRRAAGLRTGSGQTTC